MRNTPRILIAATAGALALTLTACGGGAATDSDSADGADGTAPLLKIGQFVEPASFDPAQAQEGNYIPYYQPVYDTLIKREPDGSLTPFLATEWAYNDDNTELTLTLRDDVTFTDGEAFDADVAKMNIDHFLDANGPQANQASFIESVEAVDASTLVIDLIAPDPSLEISLSNALGFMASPASVGSEAIAAAPVGSGPYTLDAGSTIVGSQYSYVRNPDYWGDALPYDQIDIMVLPDETARLNALRSGQINAGVFTGASTFQEIENAGFTVLSQSADWVGLQFYDRDGVLNPAFADPRVREAITIAVDKEAILENVLLERGELTSQIFSPSGLAYNAEFDGYERFAFDPDRARELLDEAGYAEGLVVDIPISPVWDPAIYTTIIQGLNDVGIEVTRTEYGPGETVPALTGGEHSFAYMSLALFNDWTMINQAVAPGATWNPFDTEDPTVSALIDEYQMAATDEERQAAGQSLNEYLVDEVWFGVFYRNMQTYGVDDQTEVELQVEQAVPSIYNYSPVQ